MNLTKKIAVPKDWKKLQYHPLSALLDFGVGIDVSPLVAHMKLYGYDDSEPVILLDGRILDGRHRHWSAGKANVVPTFAEFVGKDPHAFVAKHMLRRHFTPSQRAMFAAELGKRTLGSNQHDGEGGQICPPSTAEAADQLQVSERSVKNAKVVTDKGTEELQAAVKAGTIAVSTAAKVAELPREEQEKVTSAPDPKGAATKATAGGKPPKRKQGGVLFDFKKFNAHLGGTIRMFDEFKKAYPVARNLAAYMAAFNHMAEFVEAWEKAKEQVTGAKR